MMPASSQPHDGSESARRKTTGQLPKVRIAVAYADHSTHHRALQLHDHLMDRLAGEFELEATWWSFDLLLSRELFQAAVEAAVGADLILFSVHAAQHLPAGVEAWVAAWETARLPRQSALVALFAHAGEPVAQLYPVHSRLHRAAKAAAMDFLPHQLPLLAEAPCCLANPNSELVRHLMPLLEELLATKPFVPDWGLNEG